jgi:class 3 adenylate cyclase
MPPATDARLPTGTVTFLFTDIEGSTRLWEHDREAMRGALARHDELLREVIDRRNGKVFSTGGDGLAAAFARAKLADRWRLIAWVNARDSETLQAGLAAEANAPIRAPRPEGPRQSRNYKKGHNWHQQCFKGAMLARWFSRAAIKRNQGKQ